MASSPDFVVDDDEIPAAPNLVALPPTTLPADDTSLTNPVVVFW